MQLILAFKQKRQCSFKFPVACRTQLSQLLVAELWLPYFDSLPQDLAPRPCPTTLPQGPCPKDNGTPVPFGTANRWGRECRTHSCGAHALHVGCWRPLEPPLKRRRKRLRAAPNYRRLSTAWQGQEYLVNAAEPQACAILERDLMNIGLQSGVRRPAPS
jgi:hypothetical protein